MQISEPSNLRKLALVRDEISTWNKEFDVRNCDKICKAIQTHLKFYHTLSADWDFLPEEGKIFITCKKDGQIQAIAFYNRLINKIIHLSTKEPESASTVIVYLIEKAAQHRFPALLVDSTSSEIEFYEKHGFKVISLPKSGLTEMELALNYL